jgi:hypothetical protein
MKRLDFCFFSEDSCDDIIMSVIVFDDDHIWCTKKYKDTWYTLDSLSNGPRAIEFRNVFSREEFGWIIVWNNTRSISNDQSEKLSSKRHRMKENVVFDESF